MANEMRVTVFVLCFFAACCMPVYAAQEETSRVFDCGVNAVYLVRRLKGTDADLREISRNLERDVEQGSSIHDLETYLNAAGIRTDARMMRLSQLCKKRDALAILLTHPHGADHSGHFVAARVLSDGQLQIVDSLFGTHIDEGASKSKEKHPVILIDPPGQGRAWVVWAGMSAALLGALGMSVVFPAKAQRHEGIPCGE